MPAEELIKKLVKEESSRGKGSAGAVASGKKGTFAGQK
jgi:hypothetical protein